MNALYLDKFIQKINWAFCFKFLTQLVLCFSLSWEFKTLKRWIKRILTKGTLRVLAWSGLFSEWHLLFCPQDLVVYIYVHRVTWQKLLHKMENTFHKLLAWEIQWSPVFKINPATGCGFRYEAFNFVTQFLGNISGRIPHINQEYSSLQHIPSWYLWASSAL